MEQKNNQGLIALVLSIVGIVASCLVSVWGFFPIIGLAAGIIAIVFGVKGRKVEGNTGMATAGLVMGIIAVVFSGIMVACAVCICTAAVGAAAGAFGELSQYM